MPFLWDFWHFKRHQTERLSCSFCECKGLSKGVIQMHVGGLEMICQELESHESTFNEIKKSKKRKNLKYVWFYRNSIRPDAKCLCCKRELHQKWLRYISGDSSPALARSAKPFRPFWPIVLELDGCSPWWALRTPAPWVRLSAKPISLSAHH